MLAIIDAWVAFNWPASERSSDWQMLTFLAAMSLLGLGLVYLGIAADDTGVRRMNSIVHFLFRYVL